MCIKVGGWARQEVAYGYNGSMTSEWYNNNLNNRSTNNLTWRYKGTVTVDARNQTAYGTVRSYVAIGTSNNFNSGDTVASLYANRWFIQWAGFTFGHATSFYDFYSIGANQYGVGTGGSDTGDGGWDVVAYTAQFGNGLSASISAEQRRAAKITTTGTAAAAFVPVAWAANGVGYGGSNAPDIVANLRVDQAWGSAQLMGALHQVNAPYYGATEGTGHPGDAWGFAIGGGIKLNAPMIGKGDYFQAEASYTQGAVRYNSHNFLVGDYAKYDGNSIGFGVFSDAVYGGSVAAGTGSDLELTSAWSVNAAYTHNWNAAWKTTLWGSYMSVMYGDRANAMLCSWVGQGAGSGTAAVAAAGCDMDWQTWSVGLRTQWNVTSDFYLGLEVLYANLNSISTGSGTIALGGNGTKPAGTYSLSDQDNWAVRFRAHKDFYP